MSGYIARIREEKRASILRDKERSLLAMVRHQRRKESLYTERQRAKPSGNGATSEKKREPLYWETKSEAFWQWCDIREEKRASILGDKERSLLAMVRHQRGKESLYTGRQRAKPSGNGATLEMQRDPLYWETKSEAFWQWCDIKACT